MRKHLNKMKHDALRMSIAPFEAVLVGRPNCGKSAIWNRLAKKNEAIVSPIAGTTRDRKEGKVRLGELEFKIVDTGGLEDVTGEISRAAQLQTRYAVEEANAIIFCVDAKTGITTDDEFYARYLRKLMTPEHNIVLLANKTEGRLSTLPTWEPFINDCRRLGFGDPVPFSAAHGEGMADLHDALLPIAKRARERTTAQAVIDAQLAGEQDKEALDAVASRDLKLTILGRPNAGKSTLLNTITGSNRVIVGPTPGLTRDSVEVSWDYNGRKMKLVDTAGWRANQKSALYAATKAAQSEVGREEETTHKESAARRDIALLEGMSVEKAFKALGETHVAILVVDIASTGTSSGTKTPCVAAQDLTIAGKILDEGKPLILVVNKLDLVDVTEDPNAKRNVRNRPRKLNPRDEIKRQLETPSTRPMDDSDFGQMRKWIAEQFSNSVPQSAGCQIVLMSALHPTKNTVDVLMKAVVHAEERWSSRIPTPKLNRWLIEIMDKNPPANSAAASTFKNANQTRHARHSAFKNLAPIPVKLKYMTQVSSRPPTFCVFVNKNNPTNALDESYKRFLVNRLKESFDLQGVPIRIIVRSSGNPFLDKSKLKRRLRPAARTSSEEHGPSPGDETQHESEERLG